MKRFVNLDAISQIRQEYRMIARQRDEALQMALDEFETIKKHHFVLESIYGSAMDFDAKEQFTNRLSDGSKRIYKNYQENEDFEDLWKRNLGHLVLCRSIDDVMNHSEIALPIKAFMLRDTIGLFGKYFVVVEAKENDNFTRFKDYKKDLADLN